MKSVELLMHHGANVNLPNQFGTTPLMCAAVTGQLTVIKELLSRGADISVASKAGHQVLHYALCWRGHRSYVAESQNAHCDREYEEEILGHPFSYGVERFFFGQYTC